MQVLKLDGWQRTINSIQGIHQQRETVRPSVLLGFVDLVIPDGMTSTINSSRSNFMFQLVSLHLDWKAAHIMPDNADRWSFALSRHSEAFVVAAAADGRRADLLHEIPSNTHPPLLCLSQCFVVGSTVCSLDSDELISQND